ncbi:DUF4340 domain-containing protein [Capilliphycus salinus ALCB114379]|uniref:DUF4340 domain-containing protein n=1 Tax=Capilliphycus salinus TaxID=2768948 RepID=UPI0039A62DA8
MKFQRSTLILMLVALGLAGYVYVFEAQRSSQQQKIQARETQIFSFSRDDVKSVTVTTPEETIIVERISETENPQQSPWKLIQPVQTLANQATVDFLLNQLVTDQSIPQDPSLGLRRLTISQKELAEYGLEKPQQTVEVKLKNEEVYKLILGTKDFTGRSIYAQTNTPQTEETLSILVVPEGISSAINRPLDEWKLPPEEPEPTSPETSPQPSEILPKTDNSQPESQNQPEAENTPEESENQP